MDLLNFLLNAGRGFPGLLPRQMASSNPERIAVDLYGIPQYTIERSAATYKMLFKRNPLARRIIEMYPKECWRTMPSITEEGEPKETEFEKKWDVLHKDTRLKLLQNLKKADALSGIGRFGILFLGLRDGKDPGTPAGTSNNELLYVRPFDETNVSIVSSEKDRTSERFGYPLFYDIRLDGQEQKTTRVHWTRVLHITEDTIDSPMLGESRLEDVVDYVLNILLILQGSPHMYMRGGFPGYAFEAEPDVHIKEEDRERMKSEINDYIQSMTRFLTLKGVTAKSLDVQLPNPEPFLKAQVSMISTAKGIPARMLMGSEMGHLASTADKMTFEDRVRDRQETYLSSDILRPLIQRLQFLDILPQTKDTIQITWQQMDSSSQKERAEVGKIKAEALAAYANSPVCRLIIPEEHFLRLFLQLDPGQISDVLSGKNLLPDIPEDEDETPIED